MKPSPEVIFGIQKLIGFRQRGYKQQVSWKTSTHKVRAVCAIAVVLFLLFLVQIPKVVFWTALGAPWQAVWRTREHFWEANRSDKALGFMTNVQHEVEEVKDIENEDV